jgi:hypothetical protein
MGTRNVFFIADSLDDAIALASAKQPNLQHTQEFFDACKYAGNLITHANLTDLFPDKDTDPNSPWEFIEYIDKDSHWVGEITAASVAEVITWEFIGYHEGYAIASAYYRAKANGMYLFVLVG